MKRSGNDVWQKSCLFLHQLPTKINFSFIIHCGKKDIEYFIPIFHTPPPLLRELRNRFTFVLPIFWKIKKYYLYKK